MKGVEKEATSTTRGGGQRRSAGRPPLAASLAGCSRCYCRVARIPPRPAGAAAAATGVPARAEGYVACREVLVTLARGLVREEGDAPLVVGASGHQLAPAPPRLLFQALAGEDSRQLQSEGMCVGCGRREKRGIPPWSLRRSLLSSTGPPPPPALSLLLLRFHFAALFAARKLLRSFAAAAAWWQVGIQRLRVSSARRCSDGGSFTC